MARKDRRFVVQHEREVPVPDEPQFIDGWVPPYAEDGTHLETPPIPPDVDEVYSNKRKRKKPKPVDLDEVVTNEVGEDGLETPPILHALVDDFQVDEEDDRDQPEDESELDDFDEDGDEQDEDEEDELEEPPHLLKEPTINRRHPRPARSQRRR